jgi:hypothetical protein
MLWLFHNNSIHFTTIFTTILRVEGDNYVWKIIKRNQEIQPEKYFQD